MFSSYGNQKTVDMPADNYVLSKKDILIDNSLFIPDACAFEDDGIHWAVYYKIEWLR